MGQEAFEDYHGAIHDPATVHAMIEDYRAGLGIDRDHDEADRLAARRISCPTLFLWAGRDDMEDLYGDPLAIWRGRADDVRGWSIDCGHHIAKEAPAELAADLAKFFAGPSSHDGSRKGTFTPHATSAGRRSAARGKGEAHGQRTVHHGPGSKPGSRAHRHGPEVRPGDHGYGLVRARARPAAVVGQVVAMFRAEYGSENIDRYYPKRNAAVEVPLD